MSELEGVITTIVSNLTLRLLDREREVVLAEKNSEHWQTRYFQAMETVEAQRAELHRANETIAALNAQTTRPVPVDVAKLQDLIRHVTDWVRAPEGNRIDAIPAIKLIRELSRVGIKEAKDCFDRGVGR